MSALGFCRKCGNMIQKHYRFCPFCGDRQWAPADPANMAHHAPPAKTDPVSRTKNYLARLCRLDRKLSQLDRELEALFDAPAPADPAEVIREITP
jgi:hypothetical protein